MDAQEAVLELHGLALAQGQLLDSDDAASRRLSMSLLPDGTDTETQRVVHEAAIRYLEKIRDLAQVSWQVEDSERDAGASAEAAKAASRVAVDELFKKAIEELESVLAPLELGPEFGPAVRRYMARQSRRPRVPVLRESLLMTLVNDFENFIAAIAKTSYEFNPKSLGSAGKQYSWADVVEYGSIDEFTEKAIDDQVDRLMREALDDWVKFLAGATRYPVENLERCSAPLREVIQRRHALAHAGGTASRHYLANTKNLPNAGTALGQELDVSDDYLLEAVDAFAVFAIVAATASIAAINKAQKREHPHQVLDDEIVLDLLKLERYRCVAPLFSLLEALIPDAASRDVLRVNSWIATSRIDGPDSIVDEVHAWDVSNLAQIYRLARLVLLEDLPAADGLAVAMLEEGTMTFHALETWPLLAPLREYRRFEEADDCAVNSTSNNGTAAIASKQTASTSALTSPAKTAESCKSAPKRAAAKKVATSASEGALKTPETHKTATKRAAAKKVATPAVEETPPTSGTRDPATKKAATKAAPRRR